MNSEFGKIVPDREKFVSHQTIGSVQSHGTVCDDLWGEYGARNNKREAREFEILAACQHLEVNEKHCWDAEEYRSEK